MLRPTRVLPSRLARATHYDDIPFSPHFQPPYQSVFIIEGQKFGTCCPRLALGGTCPPRRAAGTGALAAATLRRTTATGQKGMVRAQKGWDLLLVLGSGDSCPTIPPTLGSSKVGEVAQGSADRFILIHLQRWRA